MPGNQTGVMSHEIRRQLLLAESEVNRATLARDIQEFRGEIHLLTAPVRSLWSGITSVAAMGIAAAGAYQDLRAGRRREGGSWLFTLFAVARIGASLAKSIRSRQPAGRRRHMG